MLRFIAADLRRHWIGVAAVALLIALATALGVAVTLSERALRLGSAQAADAFDLVIGSRKGGELVEEYKKTGAFFDPKLANSKDLPKDLGDYAELERAFYQKTGRLK